MKPVPAQLMGVGSWYKTRDSPTEIGSPEADAKVGKRGGGRDAVGGNIGAAVAERAEAERPVGRNTGERLAFCNGETPQVSPSPHNADESQACAVAQVEGAEEGATGDKESECTVGDANAAEVDGLEG